MPQTTNLLIEYALKLAAMLLAMLAALLYRELRTYLVQKIGAAKLERIQNAAEVVVRSLEQQGIIAKWDGAAKKQQATLLLTEAIERMGIEASPELIDDMIEMAVQVINTEAGKFQKEPQLITVSG